jgi:hypothetical protein
LFLFAVVVIAVGTVPLAGGHLSAFTKKTIRWTPAIFGALGLQVLITSAFPDGTPALHRLLHLASYCLAGAFIWANRSLPGMLIVGLGGLCNLVAITANLGVMPASRHAERLAGIATDSGYANSAAVAHPRLLFLGDVFAIPKSWPLHNVFSIGDVIIAVGVGIVVHALCESRLIPNRSENVAPVRDRDRLGA